MSGGAATVAGAAGGAGGGLQTSSSAAVESNASFTGGNVTVGGFNIPARVNKNLPYIYAGAGLIALFIFMKFR